MADLEIKVKVDDSELRNLESSLSQKLNNIEVDFDDSKIDSLVQRIEKLNQDSNVDIRIDTDTAISKLNTLEQQFNSLKRTMEDGIQLNINTKELFSDFNANDLSKSISKQFKNVNGLSIDIDEMTERSYAHALENARKLESKWRNRKSHNQGEDYLIQKQQESKKAYDDLSNSRDNYLNTVSNDLKQYARMAQEIETIQGRINQGNLTGKEFDGQVDRIRTLYNSMKDIEGSLSENFAGLSSKSFNSFDEITGNISENIGGMRDFARSIEDTQSAVKELARAYGDLAKLEKESLMPKNQGTNSQAQIQREIDTQRSLIQQLENSSAIQNASSVDRSMLDNLRAQNDLIHQNARARQEASNADKDLASRIKEHESAYRDLNKAIEEVEKNQRKINELESKMDSDTATTKNMQDLEAFKVRGEALKQAVEDSRLAIQQLDSTNIDLSAFEKGAESAEKMAKEITNVERNMAQARAEVARTASEYSEIEDSMKRQQQYSKNMVRADINGDENLVATYKELIDSEQRLQNEIRERINLEGRANDSLDRGLDKRIEQNKRELDMYEQVQRASALDADVRRSQTSGRAYKSIFGFDKGIMPTIDVMDVVRESVQAGKELFNMFRELDDALIDVRKVVDASDADWANFTDTIYESASAVGKTASEYATSVEKWASAGKTLAEAQELAQLSTMGAFVGNIDEASMVDYMSVPLNAFQKDMISAQDILNTMNEIANNNAIEMDDLGAAYQRAAATASQSGTSFAELTGLITAAQEATRLGGRTIGTALRAMDINFGKMFTGATKQDQDRTEFFESIGVNIQDANGGLRSTYDILEDLQGAWKDLDDRQRQMATYYASGKQYSNILSSILTDENWAVVQTARTEAEGQYGLGEAGSAYEEFSRMQEGLSYKLATLQNSWQSLLNTLLGGGSNFFGNILDGLNDFIGVLQDLAENEEAVEGIGRMIQSVIGLIAFDFGVSGFHKAATSISNGIDLLKSGAKNVGGIKKGFSGLGNLLTGGKGFSIDGIANFASSIGIAVTAFNLLDSALYAFSGGKIDISGTIAGWVGDVATAISPLSQARQDVIDFRTTFEEATTQFETTKKFQVQMEGYDDLLLEYQALYEEQDKIYQQSGNPIDLQIKSDSFKILQSEHNEMVADLGMGTKFNIVFNNYDHVMEQMEAVQAEMDAIDRKNVNANISAGARALNTLFGEDSGLTKMSRQIDTVKENVAQAIKEMDPDHYGGEGSSTYIAAIQNLEKGITDSYADYANELQKVIDAQENSGEILSKFQTINDQMYYDATRSLNSGDMEAGLRNILGNGDLSMSQYLTTMQAVIDKTAELSEHQRATESMGEIYSQWKDEAIDVGKAGAEINRIFTETPSILNNADIKQWMEKNKIDNADDIFELEDTQITEFFETILPNAIDESNLKLEQAREMFKKYKQDLNLSDADVETLMDGMLRNDGQYILDLFNIINDDVLSASMLGIDLEDFEVAVRLRGDNFTTDPEMLIAQIHNQIQSMDLSGYEDFDLEVEGEINYGKIINDLDSLRNVIGDDKLMIEMGIVGPDGNVSVDRMYAGIQDFMDYAQNNRIDLDFDVSSFDDVLKALEANKLSIAVNADGDWDFLDSEGQIIMTVDRSQVDDELKGINQTVEEVTEQEKRIPINIEVNEKSEWGIGHNSGEWILRSIFGDNGLPDELVHDFQLAFNLDLEDADLQNLDRDDINKMLQGKLFPTESQVELVAEYMVELTAKGEANFQEGDEINLDHVTKYLADKWRVAYESSDLNGMTEVVEFLINMVPSAGEIDTSTLVTEVQNKFMGFETINVEQDVEVQPTIDINDSIRSMEADELNNLGDAIRAYLESQNDPDAYNFEYTVEGIIDIVSQLRTENQLKIMAILENPELLNELNTPTEQQHTVNQVVEGSEEVGLLDEDTDSTHTVNVVEDNQVDEELLGDSESTHTTNVNFVISDPEAVQALDGQDIAFTITANMQDNASDTLNDISQAIESMTTTNTIDISLSENTLSSISAIESLGSGASDAGVNITFVADSSQFDSVVSAVDASLTTINAKIATPQIHGNNVDYFNKAIAVINHVIPNKIVNITANTSSYDTAIANLRTKTVSINVSASVSKSSSMAIGNDLGRTFSASIGSAVSGVAGRAFSNQINRSYSTAQDARVDEDVWRYWAKELFSGLPLEQSMEDLNNALSQLDGNFAEMIKIYRQQLQVTREQMQFEKDMVALQQQQMNEVLGDLRGYGFKTDGNRITNLDLAKSLSGDRASEAEKSLNTWRELYESITGLNNRISQLQNQLHDIEKDIEQAQIDEELEKLEKRLAKTETLLTNLSNHLELLNTKDSFVSDIDYELKIAVSEENIQASVSNISRLVDEFNALSNMTIDFAENAEDVQGTLEDLADEIITNADNIIKFREQINQVRIDALTEDFDRFTQAIERNADSLMNNVTLLREGLVSGSGVDELATMFNVDFTRRSELERVVEERLRLEAHLNQVLEDYAKKNIDREVEMANAQIQIARDTYDALQNIKVGSEADNIKVSATDSLIGITGVTQADSVFSEYESRLTNYLTSYQEAYNKMIADYEHGIKGALSYSDRQQMQTDLIMNQLQLQREYQLNAIEVYREAIALSREQLENESLTTEQRRELLDSIDEYTEAIGNAQSTIRDIIAERYDYEFDLMDKATAKAQTYYDSLSHMLDVGRLVNLTPDKLNPFYEALFGAVTNKYQLAKDQLAQLKAEQSKFEEGSYEWNLLADKIEGVTQSVRNLGLESLNANKAILDNTLDALQTKFETGFLGGDTLDRWKEYNENWISGIEKELRLEELRRRSLEAESDMIDNRLDMLDRQDAISNKDLEYVDKQLAVIELENKLNNIGRERNVQTLVRRDDGTWGYEYAYDQSEYESTQKELNEARLELEKYRREQRGQYVSDLGSIIDRAKAGEYESPEALQADLVRLNSLYGYLLGDLPEFQDMSLDEIVEAYRKYMSTNDIIATDILGGADQKAIQQQSQVFAQSFLEISTELGEIIGTSLKQALGLVDGSSFVTPTHIYQIGTIELPNVTDGEGLVNIFNDLPQAAEQQAFEK